MNQNDRVMKVLMNAVNGASWEDIVIHADAPQYGRCISDLRNKIGCKCVDGIRCSGQEHIYSKKMKDGKDRFFYERSGSHVDWEKMRKDTVEKLKELEVVENALF